LEALVDLHEHGYQLALLSNIWEPYLISVRRDYHDGVVRNVILGPFHRSHCSALWPLESFEPVNATICTSRFGTD